MVSEMIVDTLVRSDYDTLYDYLSRHIPSILNPLDEPTTMHHEVTTDGVDEAP